MRIPSSWSDVTIGRYQAARETFSADYFDDEVERSIAQLAAVTGCSEDDVASLRIPKLLAAIKQIDFIKHLETINKAWPKVFVIKGNIYRPIQRIDRIRGGRYLDFKLYMGGDIIDNLHLLLAVLTSKTIFGIRLPYSAKRMRRTAEFFKKELTMDIAYPIAAFFLTWLEHSTPAILTSLSNQTAEMKKKIMSQLQPTLSLTNTPG